MHLCPEGKWALGQDKWGRIVRANMLKITAADWAEAPGVKKAWPMKGFEGVAGMAFHPIISDVKDVDGDDEIPAFGLGANVDGMFSVWDGDGRRLCAISFLPSPSKRTWRDPGGGSWSHAMPGGHEGIRGLSVKREMPEP